MSFPLLSTAEKPIRNAVSSSRQQTPCREPKQQLIDVLPHIIGFTELYCCTKLSKVPSFISTNTLEFMLTQSQIHHTQPEPFRIRQTFHWKDVTRCWKPDKDMMFGGFHGSYRASFVKMKWKWNCICWFFCLQVEDIVKVPRGTQRSRRPQRGGAWLLLQTVNSPCCTDGTAPLGQASMWAAAGRGVGSGLVLDHWRPAGQKLPGLPQLSSEMQREEENCLCPPWALPAGVRRHLQRLQEQRHPHYQVQPADLHPHEPVPAVSQVSLTLASSMTERLFNVLFFFCNVASEKVTDIP